MLPDDIRLLVDRFSGGGQNDITIALRIALSRYLAELHQVHESTSVHGLDSGRPGKIPC